MLTLPRLLEGDLEAGKNDLLILRGYLVRCPAAASEIGLVVIQGHLDVFIQQPIQHCSPGTDFVSGSSRGKRWSSEKRLVHGQFAIALAHFERAPTAILKVERMQRLHRAVGVLFTGHKPGPGNLPRLITGRGKQGRPAAGVTADFLRRDSVLSKEAQGPP